MDGREKGRWRPRGLMECEGVRERRKEKEEEEERGRERTKWPREGMGPRAGQSNGHQYPPEGISLANSLNSFRIQFFFP